jgi:hypothetical protein
MTRRRKLPLLVTRLSVVALMIASSGLLAQSLGSAFTYQGQLKELGQPASGLYDLQVCLFDSPSGPTPLVCAPDFDDVPVEGGLFAITLDFGSAPFVGQQRYMELRVRLGASGGAYTVLAPRQLIRPAPEALRSNVSAAAPWSGLTGVPAGFGDGIDDDSGGTVTSIATGAGLTGGPITDSGTVAIADGGVTMPMVATGAVGSAQLANDSVVSAHIVDATIVASDLAVDSVTAAQLASDAVDTAAIIDANVTAPKIAAGAVGAAQIDAAQVQRRVTTTCPTDQFIRSIAESGAATCGPIVPPPPPPPTQGQNSITSFSQAGILSEIAIGSNGLPIVAFTGSDRRANVAHCQNAACTSRVVTAMPFILASRAKKIPLIVLPDGRAALAAGQQIAFCELASTCGIPSLRTHNDVYDAVDMVIGDDGFPIVAGVTQAGELQTLKCNDPTCMSRIKVVHDANAHFADGGELSIATFPGLPPVIAYRASGGGPAQVFRCATTSCAAATSTISTYSDGAGVGQQPAVALPADGLPVIAHYDAQNFDLMVTRCGTSDCTVGNVTTRVHSTGTVGWRPSIALPQGFPVIAYFDTFAPRILAARCGSMDCSTNVGFSIVRETESVVGDVGLALSPEQRPLLFNDGYLIRCADVGC